MFLFGSRYSLVGWFQMSHEDGELFKKCKVYTQDESFKTQNNFLMVRDNRQRKKLILIPKKKMFISQNNVFKKFLK